MLCHVPQKIPFRTPLYVPTHAGVEPPAGAVVGPAVPGRIAVVVSVRGGERPVVVVVGFAEAQSVSRGAGVPADRQPVAQPLAGHSELVVLRMLRHPVEVLQLHAQHHVAVAGQPNSPPSRFPKPDWYSAQVRSKLTLPSWRRCRRVHPPPSRSMSQTTGKLLLRRSGVTRVEQTSDHQSGFAARDSRHSTSSPSSLGRAASSIPSGLLCA
ncbi:unnamed protein product [Menidia menidia]|uniref:(Atlantic silverside) hypothetical protein n=1 Tax=Menidia menidia TaxID=238744 RepID=A0A8S4BHD1_9TELE|nr:unnamed protein product [Menidia menidia]